ncbi:MAG: VWA domain-containing protein [Acidobacteria bacterium]|nr:VWA domain-containing protein [Acidobacteriota bacterium]
MSRTRFGPAVAMACLAAAVVVSAQQRPVFRTGVQYVVVDVVVTDSNDVPITDLEVFDFEIYDRGVRERVADFRFVSIPVSTTPVEELRAAPPASDVISNARPSPDSRLFVMIVDNLHTLESEILAVKQVMTEFIAALSPDDEVAIVFVGRSDLGVNFTTDRSRLLRAVDDVRDAAGFAIDAMGRTTSRPPMTQEGGGLRAILNTTMSYGRSLAATIRTTAMALEGSDHPRRAIVYVGAGSPLDPNISLGADEKPLADMVYDELKMAFDRARRANAPIYTLDPRGMVQPADAVRGGIGSIGGVGPPSGATRPSGGGDDMGAALSGSVGYRLAMQQDMLATVAVNTGGRAFTNQSDLSRAVKAIATENGNFYVLGFYPQRHTRLGTFNDLEVKVSRPGAKVRARLGYVPTSAVTTDAARNERLATAMASGVDVRGLALSAIAAPLLPTGNVMRTAVTIHVTYPTGISGDAPFDTIAYQILALDGDGRVKATTERTYTVRPPRSERESVALVINDVIDLPSQPLTLRIGIASEALGHAGTLQVPVHVPKPSESRIQMGGVVIGASGDAGPATLGADFIKAILPFQPTTVRKFTNEQTLRVFVPVFWRGRETDATVTLTLHGPGVTLRREETLTVAEPVDGRRVTALDTLIPLDQLSGDFTLTLEARVKAGQSATRTMTFAVNQRSMPGTAALLSGVRYFSNHAIR